MDLIDYPEQNQVQTSEPLLSLFFFASFTFPILGWMNFKA